MWPGGAAKVFPPGSRPRIKKARYLATAILGQKVGEDRLHGSVQTDENLRTLLGSHADHMPRIGTVGRADSAAQGMLIGRKTIAEGPLARLTVGSDRAILANAGIAHRV